MKVEYKSSFFKIHDFKKDFFGSSPSVFVGRFNYPYVNVGILAPPKILEDPTVYDNPRLWSSADLSQQDIIDLRSSLVNSRFKSDIKFSNRYIDIAREVSMSIKGADLEVNLKKKPFIKTNLYQFNAPTGPKAELLKARITSNVKIDSRVDKVVDDVDLKADEAVLYLYKKGFEESFLTKLISLGNLGLKKNRKLVPSRFSITAIDSIIGNSFVKAIKDYPIIGNPRLYCGDYFGNYYFVLMFPEVWSYELYEKSDNGSWNDYESYDGRKSYAESTAGGFYAARLAISERLNELKRQASIYTLRIITKEYKHPLGVFVCRESARKAMKNKPLEFPDKEIMLNYLRKIVKEKFNINIDGILRESVLLKDIKEQTKLIRFL